MTIKAEDRPSESVGDSASVITFLFRLQSGLVEWRVLVAAPTLSYQTVTYLYGQVYFSVSPDVLLNFIPKNFITRKSLLDFLVMDTKIY